MTKQLTFHGVIFERRRGSMKKYFHRWALMLFIMLPALLKANFIKVNDLGDPGPIVPGNITLRDAINAAAPGDTLIMDIKGNISLFSTLVINKQLHIIGAYPIHSSITVMPGAEIQFNSAGVIRFSGFRITGMGTSSVSALRIFAGSYLEMNDCLVENITSTANGAAIFVSGQLSANYCSFINNQTTLEGGAVYMSNATYADFNSCTFGTNNASQGGGAIYCSGSLQVNNCTFADNNSASPGRDIKSNLAGALLTTSNSIYAHNSVGPADFFNGSGTWMAYNGNSFTSTPPGGTFTGGANQTISVFMMGLTALYTDGYGLKYYKLMTGSSAIDYGDPLGPLPAKDCRRAPRTLYSTALKPDCGAFEYTPYTVGNLSSSVITPGSLPYVIAQIASAGPGPIYIDFALVAPSFMSSPGVLFVSKPDVTIDGYTQFQSVVPGPGTTPGTVTPGNMGLNIQSGSTLTDIFNFTSTANSSRISGIGFYNGKYAIDYSSCISSEVFGCYFEGMSQAAVHAQGSASGLMVGGQRHFQRNVMLSSAAGVEVQLGNNVKIQGNFIGTNEFGMGIGGIGNGIGIHAVSVNNLVVGGDHFRGAGNIISGSMMNGMELDNVNDVVIHGNYIGLNYNGTGAIENHYNGIYIKGTGINTRIGKPGKNFRNYICNSDLSNINGGAAIQFYNFNGDALVVNNSMGVDRNNVNAYNATGVAIINSNMVHVGSTLPKERNIICNSLNNGVYVDGSAASVYVSKNFIGLKEDNGPGPNNGNGIFIGAGVGFGTFINNVISNNVADGVRLNGSGPSNSVSGNFIGTDSTGTLPMPNQGHGVSANSLSSGLLMFSNIISGNSLNGVHLLNTYNAVLYNNTIGLNFFQSGALPNGQNGIRAIDCFNANIGTSSYGNVIAGNNASGIHITNGNTFVIVRNFIGTNTSEAPGLGNGLDGVYIDSTSVMGTVGNISTTGDSNTIMYNGRHGVFVDDLSNSIGVNKNHFAFNTQKGIALANGGPLPNDTDDADGSVYGNYGQNYPVLTKAQRCGTQTKITGSINVDNLGTDYHLEFYVVGTPDVSGHGEGLYFLGEIILNDATNHTIPFTYNYAGLLPVGTIITSTCTKRPGGGLSYTSEFSNNVLVDPVFTADASVIAQVPCFGGATGEAHCDATGAVLPISDWNWYRVGGGLVGTGQDINILDADFYTCQVIDDAGCEAFSDTIEITEPAELLPNAFLINDETCAGISDGAVNAAPAGGTGGYMYQWTNSSSIIVSTGPYASGLAPDIYTLTVIDANMCTASANVTVNPGILVSANFSPSSTNVCVGEAVTFTDLSLGGTTWYWDFDDFTNSSSPVPPPHTYTTAGLYNVSLTLTDGACNNMYSIPITVNAVPMVNAGADMTICGSLPSIPLNGVTLAPTLNWYTLGSGSFTSPTSASTSYILSPADISSGTASVVFTVSDGACVNSDTVVITVDQQPDIVLGADITQCATNTFAISPSTFSNVNTFLWSTTGLGSFTTPTASATSYDPGADGGSIITLSLTGTSNLGVCPSVTDNINVTVLVAPTANAGTDSSVCYSTGTYTFTGASATGYTSISWSTTAAGTLVGATTLSPSYTFAPTDEDNTIAFVLTALNPSCTPVTDTVLITIDAVPTVTVGPDDVVCSGNVYNLVGSVDFATTQTWVATGGGSFTNQFATSTDYTTALTSGLDTLTLITGTNGACNAQTDFLVLTVSPAPTVDAGADFEECQSTVFSSTLNGTVTGTSTVLWTATESVSWSGSPASTTVDAIYSGAATSAGSMYFILTATAPGCAPVADSVQVMFTAPHSANAGLDLAACSSSPIALVGAAVTGPAGLTASWSGAGTFSPSPTTLTGVTYTPTAAEISAGTATVTLNTDPLGACATSSDTIIITLLTSPVADAGTDQSVCAGSPVTLNGSGSSGSITTYQWEELGGPLVGSTINVNVTPLANTSYILTVDNGTCSDADTVVVSMTAPPDASFSYAGAPFCSNDGAELPVAAIAGGYYDVVGGTGVDIDTGTGEILPSASIPGTYYIYHELTTPCLERDTITIVINAAPTVTVNEISGDYTACQLDTLYFTGAPAGGTYTALLGLNTTTGEFIGVLPGANNVTYNYTDAVTGCSASDSKTVTVNALPTVTFTPTLASTYCASDGPILLTGSPSGPTGGFALNGSLFPGSTYSYDPTTPGIDSIAYGYLDPLTGCGNFAYQLVTVTTAPATPILTTAVPYEFCGSNPQTLTVSNPGTTVTWYNDAGLTDVVTNGIDCSSSLLGSGTNTVYVVNQNSGTCVSTPLAVNYTNHTFDAVDMGGPYETCTGTPVQLMLNVPSGISYGWLPAPGLTDTAVLQPSVNPTSAQTYTVMLYVSSLPSCVAYDSARVEVRPCSLENITNAFSPDGDGVNDTWIIAGIEQHPQNRVRIYNRWGDEMVVLDGYNNTTTVWDGMYKGVKVAAGTYYYVIEYMDDGQKAAGWLQLNY